MKWGLWSQFRQKPGTTLLHLHNTFAPCSYPVCLFKQSGPAQPLLSFAAVTMSTTSTPAPLLLHHHYCLSLLLVPYDRGIHPYHKKQGNALFGPSIGQSQPSLNLHPRATVSLNKSNLSTGQLLTCCQTCIEWWKMFSTEVNLAIWLCNW